VRCVISGREELFDELVSEREDVMKKRQNCQAALRALTEAINTLDNVPQELAEQQFSTLGRQGFAYGDPVDAIKSSSAPGLGGHHRFGSGDRHPSMARAAQATQDVLRQPSLRKADGKANPFEFPS